MPKAIKTLERFGHRASVFADDEQAPAGGYRAVCNCGASASRPYYAEADAWMLAHLANADEPDAARS